MSGISTQNREAMTQAAGQIEDSAGKIQGARTALENNMNNLKAKWIGDASNAFQASYAQFDEELKKVKAGLDSIHMKLVGSVVDYTKNEDEQKSAAASLTQLLNSN